MGDLNSLVWVWPALLLTGLVTLAWGVRQLVRPPRPGGRPAAGSEPSRTDGPHEILLERFARGDITQDDLRRRLKALDGH
jgi:hypothetical protein